MVGLILLLYSGRFLVKGSVSLANHFKISTLVIGVTIVSFGTSAPELIVSLKAAIDGHPDIAMGNVIGSNISNIALVLALTAIIFPIPVHRDSVIRDWPIMMIASLLLWIFIQNLKLEFHEGLIFFLLLVGYFIWSIMNSRKEGKLSKQEFAKPQFSVWISLLLIAISSMGLVFGADFLVRGASGIALNFGVSERVISISLVAFGTSVPELVTSAVAAFRKEMDISVGNIIGSNIFNIFAVLGMTSMVKGISINELTRSYDILWMLGITILLFVFMLPPSRAKLKRWKGIIMLSVYGFYIYKLFTM